MRDEGGIARMQKARSMSSAMQLQGFSADLHRWAIMHCWHDAGLAPTICTRVHGQGRAHRLCLHAVHTHLKSMVAIACIKHVRLACRTATSMPSSAE